MKKMILVAIAIALAAGALSAFVASDYMPLTVGNYWVYEDSSIDGIDSSMTRIPGTTVWDGSPAFLIENTEYFDMSIDTTFMFFDAGSLFVVQYDPDEGDFFMMLMLPASFNVGSSWEVVSIDTTWTEGEYEYIYRIQMTATLVGVENVVAPAGLFMDCPKISQSGFYQMTVMVGGVPAYSDSSGLDDSDLWLAEDVGIVKDYTWIVEDTTEEISVLKHSNLTGIDESSLPSENAIDAYPNPFNAAVTIDLPSSVDGIEIYDMQGRFVDRVPANFGQARWNPSRSTSAGIYLVKTKSGGKYLSKKIVLLK